MMASTAGPSFTFDPAEGMSPFLRPVYFDRHVLVKYLYDPRIAVDFASETYGTVFGDDWQISFGLNANRSVIAWLGDLKDLPVGEQHHWAGSNVASEHDVRSEFFDAQIDAQFTQPPVGVRALNALTRWNDAFAAKHGSPLYRARDLDQRLQDVRRYRSLIINREDDFVRYISAQRDRQRGRGQQGGAGLPGDEADHGAAELQGEQAAGASLQGRPRRYR
jgi:hypothetical protein